MAIFVREPATTLEAVDRWGDVVGWLAHPDEPGRRVSHAVATDEGVWVLDPLDAPGLDGFLAESGPVVGVAVLSNYHTRDAATIADRHGVPVSVPAWLRRPRRHLEGDVVTVEGSLAGGAIDLSSIGRHLPLWAEAVASIDGGRILYVPDALGSTRYFTVGDERAGVHLALRAFPPRGALAGRDPARLCFGHGRGIDRAAGDALEAALSGARRGLPPALLANGPGGIRAGLEALLG